MSDKVLTREYLQSIPQKWKQELLDYYIQSIMSSVEKTAKNGATSYIIELSEIDQSKQYEHSSFPLSMSNDELVAELQTKFPGCKIYYGEVWVNNYANNRILKTGITIDWS